MAKLPAEIIQTIFLKLCSSSTTFPLRRNEPRLVATHVCSQWRAVALSTPILWANLTIHIWSSYLPLLGPIRAWISRSARSTLSFTFPTPTNESSDMIADVVFPVIHRCSFLSLQLNAITFSRLLALPPNSLCALQSVTLLVEENTQVADPTHFDAIAFQSCPELHTFALMTTAFEDSHRHLENLRIADLNIPWHQLTTLRLDSSSVQAHECLDIVRRCTSLRECRVSISPLNNVALQRITDFSRHPVVLSSLHTLRIQFPGWEDDNFMFLRALCLPRLRKFRPELPEMFNFPEWTTDPAPWSLSVMQSVSCDTLEELDLSEFPVFDSLSETLARMRNLTILWLDDDSHQYPRVMHMLGKGTIAPRLITLHFGLVESFDFMFDVLEARVAAACAGSGITAFANVTTREGDSITMDEARLIALMETGVQIGLGHDL